MVEADQVGCLGHCLDLEWSYWRLLSRGVTGSDLFFNKITVDAL